MMRNQSCPATSTAIQLGAVMSVIGAGAMHAAEAARQAGIERREASIVQAYADALQSAQTYAYEAQAIAEAAIARVHALEEEVADLCAACRQRQGVIDRMGVMA